MECSAKSGQNIDAIFMQISETIVGKIDRGEIDPKNESIGIKLGTL
jgi:Ras-related protein Rab-2A